MPFTRVPNASNIVPGFLPGLPPPVDLAERLISAPRGRDVMLDLQQASLDKQELLRSPQEEEDSLRRERHFAEARHRHLTTPRAAGGAGLDADDVSVVDVVAKLAQIDERMKRLRTLID